MLNLASFNKLLKKKQKLLKCVFGSLLIQICITAFIVFHLYQNKNLTNIIKSNYLYSIALFLVGLFVILILSSDKLSFNTKFMFFMFFGIIQGILLGVFQQYFPEDVVKSALISTITIFITFLFIGFTVVLFGYDLTWMGIYLFIALLALVIYKISLFFIPTDGNLKSIMITVTIMLFSIYIIYDTNQLLLKVKNKDCIYFDIY